MPTHFTPLPVSSAQVPGFGFGRWLPWALFALMLFAAPLVFRSSLALTLLSQAGYLVIICLSYNILLGQGGMLSFGHAVYSGLGSYLAIHAMNLAASGALPLPLPLIPLAGGLSGLFFAALLGYVSTKKSGTTFAMITLGVGELVFALALMFPAFFGGEGGVTANRVYGRPLFGINFGPQFEVYYLIAVYCLICTAAMFAFTLTPLGQLLNAVRDNPERAEFIGYDSRRVRYYAFMVAGFFAGTGGGLAAINSEAVTPEALGGLRSASLLLFTFVGGSTWFFGPVIGAALLVLSLTLLSGLSMAWLLYVGLLFLVMVMYAPGGIASLIVTHFRIATLRKLRQLGVGSLGLALAALAAIAGAAVLIELVYHLQLAATLGPELDFAGMRLSTAGITSWLGAGLTLLIGMACFELMRRPLLRKWKAIGSVLEDGLDLGKLP